MAQPVPPANQNAAEVGLFWKSDPGWVGPDLEFPFAHIPFNPALARTHPNSVTILPAVTRPMSRGWVRLASANPLDKPLIHPNYLAAEADLTRLVQGVRMARQIFATRAFAPWAQQELTPGPDVRTDGQLRSWVRQNADSFHHQGGSCKMGSDEAAVVDPHLRVYGVEGLRVADASVMPSVPSGNCHAAILMIAERAADFVKKEHGLA
jgi:choline dehydrogenase